MFRKVLIYGMVFFSSSIAYSGSLKDANAKIPEIVSDPPILLDVLFELDSTNRVEFLKTLDSAVNSFPSTSTNGVARLKKEIEFYAFCATNNKPNTVLRVPWDKQLEYQHLMQLQKVDSSSYWAVEDVNIGSGSSLSTQPFEIRVRPNVKQVSPTLEPRGYIGQ